jgi:hypothetical protein
MHHLITAINSHGSNINAPAANVYMNIKYAPAANVYMNIKHAQQLKAHH